MEDVESDARAATVKRDWEALQALLHKHSHWLQAGGQVVRGWAQVHRHATT